MARSSISDISLRRRAAYCLFERHEVWEKNGDTVLVYQVFRDIRTNRYRVQQVDSLSEKHDLQSFQRHLASQKHIGVQVFLEWSTSTGVVNYDTIVDAIAAFWQNMIV